MNAFLSLFIRDELTAFQNTVRKPPLVTSRLRELVSQNTRLIINRAQTLGCKNERDNLTDRSEPLNQTVLDLISQATNPLKLAQMEALFMPQF